MVPSWYAAASMRPASQWPPVTNTPGKLRFFRRVGLHQSLFYYFFKLKIQRTLWQKAEPMLNARAKMAYFSDGQKMYVAGGLGASGGPIDSVEVYEIGRWTTKMSLPTATEG